jgi:hypothetical protein
MDVITHLTPTRSTPSAPHGAQGHTLSVTPDTHVDACVPTVTNEPFFGGRTRIRFGDRQKQGRFCRRLHGRIYAVTRNGYGLVLSQILNSIVSGAHRD